MLKHLAVALVLSSFLAAQTQAPERKVEGNVITSTHDPSVRIQLPASVHYVGADRWVLYGIADCELHAFVEADDHKKVERLYWIQFESYVPTRPELHHTYDSPRHATLGGMDFYVDTSVRANDAPRQPGSDREHMEALIRSPNRGAHGYTMPAGMMYVRLVHLLDDQKRKELMIIYGEDLAPTGFTAADLAPGGKAYDRWPALEKSLIKHAEKRIIIQPTPTL